jgi:hypothetical protein
MFLRAVAVAAVSLVVVSAGAAQEQPGPNDYGPLPTIAGMSSASRIEPRFSRAAALVSGGRAVELRCWSVPDWQRLREEWAAAGDSAYVTAYLNPNDEPGSPRVQMSPTLCSDLSRLTYKRAWRTTSRKLDLAFAVVTLAHEAQHLRGFSDEPTAECYGMQRARMVARALGLTLAEANKLVAVYWQFGYRRQAAKFRSAECRQGGRLDLNVTRVFP